MEYEHDQRETPAGAPLSDREKDAIRARLKGFIDTHPARAPLLLRSLDAVSGFTGIAMFRKGSAQFAAATVALVLVVSTGTAYAAGNSLPGNPLYTVKVDIEEPIQGAFATTPAGQAAWSAELASRRLAEAETLAAQDKLTPQAAATVASGLDQATAQFDTSVSQIATSSGNDALATNVVSNMAATLAANTQVLTQLQSAVPNAASSIAPLLSRVRTRAEAVDNTRAQLATATAQTDVSEGQVNAANVNVTFAATSSDADASSTIAEATSSADATASSTSSIVAAQQISFDEQVARLHTDIADQLQSATGVDLSLASTSSATEATSSVDVSATTTNATSSATIHIHRK